MYLLLGIGITVAGIFLWWLYQGKPNPPFSLFVVSDPMILAVYQGPDSNSTKLLIPSDVEITGLYGVGNYSLESLWKLGNLSGGRKDLLSSSLSEAIGIPISASIEPQAAGTSVTLSGEGDSYVKHLSLLRTLQLILSGRYTGRMRNIIWAWWYFRGVDVTRWHTIDLSREPVLTETALPDGTMVEKIDPDAFDTAIATSFENTRLRQEGLNIAVYNTTGTANIGERVARYLDHAGIYVVSVGNAEPPLSRCMLFGSVSALQSQTSAFITSLFQCESKTETNTVPADLVLRIGTDYSRKFERIK